MRKIAFVTTMLATAMPSVAHAALYNIIVIDNEARVCSNVNASTPKGAFRACFQHIGLPIPATAAVVTKKRVCKSTHRIQQVNTNIAHWGYDSRLSYATRPYC